MWRRSTTFSAVDALPAPTVATLRRYSLSEVVVKICFHFRMWQTTRAANFCVYVRKIRVDRFRDGPNLTIFLSAVGYLLVVEIVTEMRPVVRECRKDFGIVGTHRKRFVAVLVVACRYFSWVSRRRGTVAERRRTAEFQSVVVAVPRLWLCSIVDRFSEVDVMMANWQLVVRWCCKFITFNSFVNY